MFEKILLKKKQEEWSIIFMISAIVYFVGGLTFLLLANSDTQRWAKTKTNSNEKELLPLNEDTNIKKTNNDSKFP